MQTFDHLHWPSLFFTLEPITLEDQFSKVIWNQYQNICARIIGVDCPEFIIKKGIVYSATYYCLIRTLTKRNKRKFGCKDIRN